MNSDPRSAGADANKAAYGGFSPLHVASEEGHLQVIRQLVEGRARIDAGSGSSALHSAVQKGHISVAQCLLETWMMVGWSPGDVPGAGVSQVYPRYDGHFFDFLGG